MKEPNQIWDELGNLPEDEAMHVLTKLFFAYEEQLTRHPEDKEAANFFQRLDTALSQTSLCNLNRR